MRPDNEELTYVWLSTWANTSADHENWLFFPLK